MNQILTYYYTFLLYILPDCIISGMGSNQYESSRTERKLILLSPDWMQNIHLHSEWSLFAFWGPSQMSKKLLQNWWKVNRFLHMLLPVWTQAARTLFWATTHINKTLCDVTCCITWPFKCICTQESFSHDPDRWRSKCLKVGLTKIGKRVNQPVLPRPLSYHEQMRTVCLGKMGKGSIQSESYHFYQEGGIYLARDPCPAVSYMLIR